MKIKKLTTLILCIITLLSVCSYATNGVTTGPSVSVSNYILINMDTGEMYWGGNENERKYPASTTKVMTALLALENLDLEEYSTVSREAVMSISWDSSKLGLFEGESFSNYDLIKGMMVVSGNDAANVLAEAVSGSISDFVALMNKRAKELGCTNTNFVNTHGLTDENHYTTAADMAKIAKKAMENPTFREIVKETYFELPATDIYSEARVFYTTNNLLTKVRTSQYIYSPATGIKTGYTDAARNCLVASAEKDGIRLLTVVLGASNIDGVNMAYKDTVALMEWGFNNYKSKTVLVQGEIYDEKSIKYAKGAKTVKLVAKNGFETVLHKDADEELLTTKVTVNTPINAPVSTEDTLGFIEVFYDGELLGTVDIGADKDYEYSWWQAFWGIIGKIIGIFLLAVVAIIVIFVIIRQVEYEKRKKARRRQQGRNN